MIIYSQHFFRRRTKQIPSPSCIPITIMLVVLLGVVIALMPSVITGVNIEMPQLNTEPLEIYDDFIYTTIYITDNDIAVIGNNMVNIGDIGKVVKTINKDKDVNDIKIFIIADKNIAYNTMLKALESLNDKGFKDVSLVGKYSGKKQY